MKLKSNFVSTADTKSVCSHIYYLVFRVLARDQIILPPEEFLINIRHSSDIFQLEEIVERLLLYAQKTLTASERKYSPYIQDAICYIKEHLSEGLMLEDIAQHVHMNSSYLSRTFRKECGYSITEYIATLRIEKAKELLANNAILTYEVAEQIGINNPSYFSLLFKRQSGLSMSGPAV